MRKSVSFWKLLGEKGVFSTVLRVPITFPPEKFKGHLLSGMCAPDLKGSQGTFSFYTTDPAEAAKREGGVAIPVVRQGDVIRTGISGPENSLLKTPVEIRLPLTITLNDQAETAVVQVSGQRLELKKRTFSPWIRLTFRPGLGMKIRAICRFYVREIRPHFEMYVTPLNIDPEKPALPISHPFIYSVYLSKLLGSFITLGEANDTWALNEGVLDESAFLELTYDNHLEWERMLFNALKKTPKGLVAIVFETTDSIQHMFFRYLDKTHPALRAGKPAMSGRVIEDLYLRMDDLVGRVCPDPRARDALLIMSDHGFKSFRRGVNLNSWLWRNGYLALRDGGRRATSGSKDVDWDRTRAYGSGSAAFTSTSRAASPGNRPAGRGGAGQDRPHGQAQGLKDTQTGDVAVNQAFDRDAIYAGPYRDNAPDLIIGYNEGFRASWDSVTGKVNEVIFEDNTKAWSGDHCIDPACVPGVLFSSLKLRTDTPSIMDLAPTILRLFGLEPPKHMDGRSLLAEAQSEAQRPPSPLKKKGKNA
jgi:predicted AlkP superfamily phosphohydrolase/phosphomutase